MNGEGDTESPSSSKDDLAAGLAIPHVVKFDYREFVVTGDKWMARPTCHKCNKHVHDNARITTAFTKHE